MRNKYIHNIELKKLEIRNQKKFEFIDSLEKIPYRGYEVEQLADGRKVVITKPGGKSSYGTPKKVDFLVFIYSITDNSLWQITHKQLLDDLYSKSEENKDETLKLIGLLQRTLEGAEPNDFIKEILALNFSTGEPAEALIKVYKWIWGQEDVNYPNGHGRYLSWEAIEELKLDIG